MSNDKIDEQKKSRELSNARGQQITKSYSNIGKDILTFLRAVFKKKN